MMCMTARDDKDNSNWWAKPPEGMAEIRRREALESTETKRPVMSNKRAAQWAFALAEEQLRQTVTK